MNLTFNDLVTQMKNSYFSVTGETLLEDSETAKRLEAVASELYSLSCYGDYIFKQAFVQTATGKYLDYHAQLRGVTRKTASSSAGEVTFSVIEPLEEDIIIPKGTVCSVYAKPYLQFATDSETVLEAGSLNVTAAVTALGEGEEYNVEANQVTVMVNAPTSIYSVVNSQEFTGGCNEESDASLRIRILNHYAMPANGVSCQSVENVIMNLDYIVDCNVFLSQTSGKITVIVKTKTGELEPRQKYEIQDALGFAELVGASVEVVVCGEEDFTVVVEANVRYGFDKTEIENQISQAVNEVCSALKIGEPLSLNTISKQLIKIDGISIFNVYSNQALGEVVNCSGENCLHLSDLVVNCFDE